MRRGHLWSVSSAGDPEFANSVQMFILQVVTNMQAGIGRVRMLARIPLQNAGETRIADVEKLFV